MVKVRTVLRSDKVESMQVMMPVQMLLELLFTITHDCANPSQIAL